MSTITDLQEAIASSAERVGPAVVGFGRGWGRGSGVVVAPGRVLTNAHNLRGADGHRQLRRRPPGARHAWRAPIPTSTSPPCGWTPATSSPSTGSPTSSSAGIGAPVIALANRGGRGLRATLGFVSVCRPRDPRARGGARSPAASSTPPRCRAARGAGRSSTPKDGCSGLNTIRLEGGLIVAVPAAEELATRAERLWSGAARSACGWVSRSHLRAWPGACAARSACPSARACWCARSRTTAPPPRPASSAAT